MKKLILLLSLCCLNACNLQGIIMSNKDYYNELVKRKKEIEKGNYTEHDLIEVD